MSRAPTRLVAGSRGWRLNVCILVSICSFPLHYYDLYFHDINSLISNVYAVALIGGSLFFLQQFAGINGVLYFSSLTFRDVGITSGILASLYVGITNFAGLLNLFYNALLCGNYS